MAIKGFFFDLDGTLVNTHNSNYLAYRNAVEAVKSVTLGDELMLAIRSGENSNSFLLKLLPGIDEVDVDSINNKKKDLYPQYLDASELNEYLTVFLAQMSKHYTIALVTTAKKGNALAVLRQYKLERFFNFMVFGDDVNNMKPHPEIYKLALDISGLKANEVIAFEDSDKGIASAEAAGISTIHIRNFI